ncbi:uridine phosphorylase [Maribacter vaceletii]|uniref:Uridine phosphorylase n=1 Tax=Maribacter vaceletii TaxID=1206816 RepID=A0A495E9H2_9FLAO|nr:nucleoside phosphorylase [Maribacter vaceletii]RKR13153.1 uridine phosphorylase [Maribacter vaceletii]
MNLSDSELIINKDGSIYHLNLLPEDIATTIIFVGDQNRVSKVSQNFDSIEVKKEKREFVTHTGHLNGKRISVISTGIGTDNIDIVINELDALVNIDFKTRKIKEKHTSLNFIRIGTSGSIQPDIPVDSFLMSEYAIGFDGLLHFYDTKIPPFTELINAFIEHTNWSNKKADPYIIKYDEELGNKILSNHIRLGFTGTNTGFYGPQGRSLRLAVQDPELNDKLSSFEYNNLKLTNLEMETSGIYTLSALLNHKAVSLNCIIANRSTGDFSKNPEVIMTDLIKYTLKKLTED